MLSQTQASSVTAFQQRVYDAIQLIPAGKVVTYGELARFLECRSAQAVGQALRRNPFAPEVPCHRVVKGDHSIGGYAGKIEGEKIQKKVRLLMKEGVIFNDLGRVEESSIWAFDVDLRYGSSKGLDPLFKRG